MRRRSSLLFPIALTILLVAVLAGTSDAALAAGRYTYPDNPAYRLTQVQCQSASACRASGDHGAIYRWDGHSWAKEVTIHSTNSVVSDLSCTSNAFCMAAWYSSVQGSSVQGAAYLRNGKWTVVTLPGALYGEGVSCSFHGFCMEIGRDYTSGDENGTPAYRTWNGTRWTALRRADGLAYTGNVHGLDCYSSTRCRTSGTDYEATKLQRVYTWSGTTWHGVTIAKSEPAVNAVDCASASHCVAVGNKGTTWTLSGGAWSSAHRVGAQNLYAVSCPSTSFCNAVGDNGATAVLKSGHWTIGQAVGAGTKGKVVAVSISCPASYTCHAVTDQGGIYRRGSMGTWHEKFHD